MDCAIILKGVFMTALQFYGAINYVEYDLSYITGEAALATVVFIVVLVSHLCLLSCFQTDTIMEKINKYLDLDLRSMKRQV